MATFVGAAEPLTKQGFNAVLEDLDLGAAELVALLLVETKSCGYLPDRRPIILFERHWFHKLTGGRFSAEHPDISNPAPGGYLGLAKEYPRLEKAAALDRAAALKSASWGAGQVMGFNHALAGWPDVESMVADMMAGEDHQLRGVAEFLKSSKLDGALRNHDWARVAKAYNGAAYAKNKYDQRLDGEYRRLAEASLLPDIDVRRTQLYLRYLGHELLPDGLYGRFSRDAVLRFRQAEGVGSGERIDKTLLEALRAKVAAL